MEQKIITKALLTLTIIILTSSLAQAVIISSTTANQLTYKNGDLIIITIQTNAENLEVTADFTAIDSNYNPGSVIIEPEGLTYTISYPITFSNNKGDNTYNAIITVYDPQTSTTSTVTYGITLTNQGERLQDTQELTIKVSDEASINVQDGYIQICTSDKCETLTEKEYEASRNYIITSGKVTLSNLTYNQLRDEIQAAANQKISEELERYLTQIIEIKRNLDQNLYDMQQLYITQQNLTENYRNETQKILKAGNRNNLISVAAVVIMIISFAYVIYLRTETTWLSR